MPLASARRKTTRLRIAIDGAQSTGKTTVFNHLRNAFRSAATFIPEASRKIALDFGVAQTSDWPELLSNPSRLREFFDAEEKWQRSAEDASDMFVADSSLLLVQAYRCHFEQDYRFHCTFGSRYDVILYCPLSEGGVSDGFRFLDGRPAVAKAYEAIVLEQFHGDFIELPFGPSRLQTAELLIQHLLQKHYLARDPHE
jgi:nicotinamide riboside kinase